MMPDDKPLLFEVQVDARTAAIHIEAPVATVTATTYPLVVFATSPGPRGKQGLPGEGVQFFSVALDGIQDGVNTAFTVPDIFREDTTAVYINGLREFQGEGYTEIPPSTIEFADPPAETDKLRIDYIVE